MRYAPGVDEVFGTGGRGVVGFAPGGLRTLPERTFEMTPGP